MMSRDEEFSRVMGNMSRGMPPKEEPAPSEEGSGSEMKCPECGAVFELKSKEPGAGMEE